MLALETQNLSLSEIDDRYQVTKANLAECLTRLRERRSLTRIRMGVFMGVKTQSVQYYEAGMMAPSVKTLMRTLNALPWVTPEEWEEVITTWSAAKEAGSAYISAKRRCGRDTFEIAKSDYLPENDRILISVEPELRILQTTLNIARDHPSDHAPVVIAKTLDAVLRINREGRNLLRIA